MNETECSRGGSSSKLFDDSGSGARSGHTRRQLLAATAAVSGTTLLASGTGGAQQDADGPEALDGRSWDLTWSDEFDGERVDDGVWSFRTGGGCGPDGSLGQCNWGNSESQYYTDGDNARVEDGSLIVEAREEQVSGRDADYEYTSARMVTSGNVSTQYGRVDVRARMPIGQGIWPAVWMLPEGNWTWPDDGEIDIVEYLGHEPAAVHGTVHGPGYSGADGINASYVLEDGSFHDSFHVFSIVWDPDRIGWFVDGERFHEVTRAEVEDSGDEWVFDDQFHVIANVAVGGEWPGYPDETTEFPQQLEIDYVRFFEEADDQPTCGGQVVAARTTVDGQTVCDLNDDGSYRDVTADGTVGQGDVAEFFSRQHRDAWKEPELFDFSGNGAVTHGDVVELADFVALE